MNRRGLLIANSQGGGILPSGYTQLNYLESTGTQWMLSGITGITTTDEFEMEVAITNRTYPNFFGWDYQNSYFDINGAHPNKSYIVEFAWGTGNTTSMPAVTVGTKYLFSAKLREGNRLAFGIDESYSSYWVTTQTSNYNQQSGLFCRAQNNTARLYAHCKIYSFKYWRGGELVADFIPCLDNNNVPCMYDTVSKNTFYNQGSGTFLYG